MKKNKKTKKKYDRKHMNRNANYCIRDTNFFFFAYTSEIVCYISESQVVKNIF